MTLRGKTPTTQDKRLKALFYGSAGVGKTTAAIQFPAPYLIDTERGAENEQYVDLLKKAGGAVFQSTDPDEVIAELRALVSEKHNYKTVIIDPLSTIYNELLDKGMQEKGEEFGRYKIPADRKIKHILNLLLRGDFNVIITSHAKPKWVAAKDAKGKDTAVQQGLTFDCYGRLDYLFDLVIEVEKRGKDRVGVVRKTRLAGFPEGDVMPFSYDEIAARYGRAMLERGAVAETLASPEQCGELRRLCELTGVSPETQQKWLDKALAESFAEMPANVVEQCIKWCKSRVDAAEVK